MLLAHLPDVVAAHMAYTKMEAASADVLAEAWARVSAGDSGPGPSKWHGWGFRDFLSCPKDHLGVLVSMVRCVVWWCCMVCWLFSMCGDVVCSCEGHFGVLVCGMRSAVRGVRCAVCGVWCARV